MGLPVFVPFPSGRPKPERVSAALSFLESWPIEISCPLLCQPARWASDPDYLCGSDSDRWTEMVDAWTGQDTIWCGRGGYGATRLLSYLDQALQDKTVRATRMLGYSDITALFAYIQSRRLPIECVHAPVLTEIPDHPAPQQVLAALRGEPGPLPVSHPGAELAGFEAPLWGGNLAVLASLCGTPWLPRLPRTAIMLEDIDEAPYRLDRFVTQLEDSGFFQETLGVFLGQFTKCQGEAGLLAVRRRLEELGVPVLGQLPVGHEAMHVPLFLGLPYRFDAETSTLRPSSDRVGAQAARTAANGTDRG